MLMFEQLQLTIKRGNRAIDPDEPWNSSDRLYCAGILQAGFGEVLTWQGDDLLSVRRLIAFYHELRLSVASSAPVSFQHSFPYQRGTLQIHWTVQPHAQLNFTITQLQGPREREVLIKSIDSAATTRWLENTYATLLSQATETMPSAISLQVGEWFAPGDGTAYRFSPGQKVRTVLTTYSRTLHIGYIFHCMRHETESTNCYQLLVDGRPLKKSYAEEDLEAMG